MSKNILDSAVVRWNDGSYDVSRDCVMCASSTCSMPVHNDNYRIKITGKLDPIEEHQEVSEIKSMGIHDDVMSDLDKVIMAEDAGEDDINETN